MSKNGVLTFILYLYALNTLAWMVCEWQLIKYETNMVSFRYYIFGMIHSKVWSYKCFQCYTHKLQCGRQ